MKARYLTPLLLLATPAAAQPGTIPMKFDRAPREHHRSVVFPFFGFPFAEREVVTRVVEREAVREVPAAAPAAPPPPPPREPYVVGRTYDSLPAGCMKMVEAGATYFLCGGDWYRQVGRAQYKAVEMPL